MSRARAVVDGCEGARSDPTPDTANGQVAGRCSHDGYTTVWVRGEIDMATGPDLMKELAETVRVQQCRVVVDLTDVTFMDATGLSVLVLARRRANAGSGEVRLVGATGIVRKVLRITGLDETFPVHSTIEESIGQGPAVQHNGTAVPHNGTAVPRPAQAEFRGLSSRSLHK